MSTMTIRYPETLEPCIEKLMIATGEATKNGAINAAIRNYDNLLDDIESLTDKLLLLQTKFDQLQNLVIDFQESHNKLLNYK